ncbi:unnamed protein product [Allacma fusca]|uniref:60S ribosomal protein L23 n=1 Tax=Allacma fusca TaxID=39272 RepID=A0A8J2KR72_9HEXA|nr:unnamed protein product [Allacma fusca]
MSHTRNLQVSIAKNTWIKMLELLSRGLQRNFQQIRSFQTAVAVLAQPQHNPSVGKHHHPPSAIHKLTRLRCVDNSAIGKQAMAEGKPLKVIHVYTKTGKGGIGDKVLMTIKGEMKKGIIVGVKMNQKTFLPKTDTNNVVLVDDNGTPLGTRIHVPIPMVLRSILKNKSVGKGQLSPDCQTNFGNKSLIRFPQLRILQFVSGKGATGLPTLFRSRM